MHKEDQSQNVLGALTNLFVLFLAIFMLGALGLVRWVNLGQWPDTLRTGVVVAAVAMCFGFVFIRRELGLVPRPHPASTLTISVWYAIGLVGCLLAASVLMTWAIVRPN
jgi:hypothetical protein